MVSVFQSVSSQMSFVNGKLRGEKKEMYLKNGRGYARNTRVNGRKVRTRTRRIRQSAISKN